MLSGIQHFVFCKRQWALIHIENVWQDNYHTAIGNVFHEKVHNSAVFEKRGNIITSRAMPIHSSVLGISGECDVVEFHQDMNGIKLYGREGKYIPYPIEYKKGNPKKNDIDILQLTAQSICLEEMFLCNIKCGYLYYGKTRHRERIEITEELKAKVCKLVEEMHLLYNKGYTPKVKFRKDCDLCSLKELCMPVIYNKRTVKEYIEKRIKEEE